MPNPRVLQRRRALVGPDGDVTLAESPLGVLLARDLIHPEERQAGQRFAWLYRLVVGRMSPAAADPFQPREEARPAFATPPLGAGQSAWLAARSGDFEKARQALKAEGPGVYEQVRRIAVAEEFPPWIVVRGPLHDEARKELEAVQAGLACLAALFGLPAARRLDAG
ncbi:MAG: hypothetical protein AAFY02_13055 [Pseudomonadota bacterium]